MLKPVWERERVGKEERNEMLFCGSLAYVCQIVHLDHKGKHLGSIALNPTDGKPGLIVMWYERTLYGWGSFVPWYVFLMPLAKCDA